VRKTVAVLIDYIDHLTRGYEFELREAFDAGCRRLDLNLVMLSGRALEHPDPCTAAHNLVYEVVGPALVDGVILVSAGLANHAGIAAVARLADRYRELPICSFGVTLAGIPSVTVDSQSGMEALVEHVVGEHACGRIAYVGGPEANPDARLRFEVFRQVMLRHGKRPDPRLIRNTDFTFAMGQQAVEELVRSGTTFDAVIAANDGLGRGAIEALRAHNLRVPLNVLVTGFDDLALSRPGDPPLTTVRQPLREMAHVALDLVLDQIAGRRVPPCTTLASEFIARESCGCGSPATRAATSPPRAVSRRAVDFVRANSTRLLRLIEWTQRSAGGASAERATRILAALEAELSGERLAFVVGLESLLGDPAGSSEVCEDLQRAVTTLRSELRAVRDPQLEELWHEARAQIAVLNTHALMRQIAALEDRYDRLLRTGERFSTNLGLASLKSVLLEELPVAQVDHAFVALYSQQDRQRLEPFFCLRDGTLYEPPPEPYEPARLFPVGLVSPERRYTWIVLPLTFESERLGVVGFELATSIVAYEMFRDRISAALKTAAMHHEIVCQTAAQERSNQERLAAAERIKSLSVLAGGVAHDLNNALGPLVALPDVIMQQLRQPKPADISEDAELVADLAMIKAAALRAAETIKDLLTLGRQHQVGKETVDLNQIVASCAAGPQELASGANRQVTLEVTLAEEPLFVCASESHVARAITNLLRNAAEATAGEGVVCVRTFALRLAEPLSGYEVVDPGDYAAVSVSDRGKGIPRAVLHSIFEPFFSGKGLHDASGSGLGLAIVHGVVKEHAGFIDVESKLGSGTVFTLYFPRSVPAPKSDQVANAVSVRGRGRILVVDDDPMQLRTSGRILTRAGYEVSTANTAARAYDLFRNTEPRGQALGDSSAGSPFDLVILDMILNDEEDGLDVFERIRRWYPQQRGILVSGHAPMERGELALERGMTWLSKPYTAEILVDVVQRTLLGSTRPSGRDEELACPAERGEATLCEPAG
jgi:DNA-binding LacI/PurR family transcriptional regulator/signal transduction histidine kinase/ActR/RegA family two-component response regulator